LSGPKKASSEDLLGRFREVVSDPLNLLIERVPMAGCVEDGNVFLHNGIRVPFKGDGAYYGLFSQLLIINRGVHEPLEEYVFQEVLRGIREAPVMLELGAYWAHYSMWLQKHRPQATLFMVEPRETAIAVGMNNLRVNECRGQFIKGAIGRNALNVDGLMPSLKIDHLDILHADIQGAELEMLEGAHQTFSEKRVDYVFVSTHGQDKHYATIAALERLRYRVEVASDFDNETTSYDGFVFASGYHVAAIFEEFRPSGRLQIISAPPRELVNALTQVRTSRDAASGTTLP